MKAEALPMPDNASRHNEPFMPSVISVTNLSKTYASGFQALRAINLHIRRGEIFALLGPNGAGKTTLINIICGIVNPTEGRVLADGHDIIADYRAARAKIGLVPAVLILVDGGEAEGPHRLGKGLGGYSWPVGSDSRLGWRCSTAC